MKHVATIILCLAVPTVLLLSGCVSRTVTIEPEQRGDTAAKKSKYGSDPHAELVEKKIVWIWQKEFRNAQ
jgi:hypothetical protein